MYRYIASIRNIPFEGIHSFFKLAVIGSTTSMANGNANTGYVAAAAKAAAVFSAYFADNDATSMIRFHKSTNQ